MGRRALQIGEWGTITTFERYGGWYARGRYRHQDGVVRPHEMAGKNPRAAKSALKRQFEQWSESNTSPLTGRSKLADAIAEHFTWVEGEVAADRMSTETLRTYRSIYRNHLQPAIVGWKLTDVTTQRIDRLLRGIETSAGQGTALIARSILSPSLQIARRYNAIAVNPMHDTRPTARPARKPPVYLTQEQVQQLLEKLRADPHAVRADIPDLALWMLTTSERIGNALAAEWSRIDLDTRRAQLGPIVVHVKSEGLRVRAADTSSKARSRTIVVPDIAHAMLQRRRAAQPPFARFVFPARRLDQPRHPTSTGRSLKAACSRAGFPWITGHVFRKTAANALGDGDVQTRIVSDYLGHSREEQTLTTYVDRHADDPRLVARLNEFYAPIAEVVDLDARRTS